MNRFLIISVLVFMSLASFSQGLFENYFEKSAIRYDFELVGNQFEVDVVPVQVKHLTVWGGNIDYLIEDLNLGSYSFQLFDIDSQELIFQKGFCPLFWEWQTTAEAKFKKKTFYQALFFPKPKRNVKVVINTRDADNNWISLFSDTLIIDNYFIKNEIAKTYEIDTILYSGDVNDKIDIIILAEGYVQNEMPKFADDSKRLTDSLFAAEPFKNLKDRLYVFELKIPSLESGTDIQGQRIYKNTAFNSHFYTFDSPRYLTSSDMKSIFDALDNMGWDQIYLLVNSSKYGGGGFYNFLNICSSDNIRSPFVFCHEFGHGFGGLGDEYYTSDTSYEDFVNKQSEPWEPNLTTMVNFDNKWKSMIHRKTPIPTPRDSLFQNRIGVFEGGGYEAKGVYSPVMSCWMKEMVAGEFCPVCQSAIEKVILNLSK